MGLGLASKCKMFCLGLFLSVCDNNPVLISQFVTSKVSQSVCHICDHDVFINGLHILLHCNCYYYCYFAVLELFFFFKFDCLN